MRKKVAGFLTLVIACCFCMRVKADTLVPDIITVLGATDLKFSGSSHQNAGKYYSEYDVYHYNCSGTMTSYSEQYADFLASLDDFENVGETKQWFCFIYTGDETIEPINMGTLSKGIPECHVVVGKTYPLSIGVGNGLQYEGGKEETPIKDDKKGQERTDIKPLYKPDVDCIKCHGSGAISCTQCNGRGELSSSGKCDKCHGSGIISCNRCGGSGKE